MKLFAVAGCALLLGSTAYAGGLDRSGQDSSIIFEDGSHMQLSFGKVNPSVTGSVGMGAVGSGDVAPKYNQTSFGLRHEINPNIGVAVIFDQPFGANVDYPTGTGYPLAGTTADLSSTALTVLGQYKLSDRFSVIAGLRQQSIDGEIFITGGYTMDASDNGGVGFVAGAAYEIPDIALRVAATYNSGIHHTMTGTELGGPVSFDIRTPQSLNLTAQSGIAADTLLFGSVRWVDWDAFDITPPGYAFLNGGASLVDYDNDAFTYTLGVGRRFSDSFSGSISVGYEKAQGTPASNLSPTDGYLSVQLGGEYAMDNMTISGGVRYINIGDATTEAPVSGDFADNSAIAFGLQVGYSM